MRTTERWGRLGTLLLAVSFLAMACGGETTSSSGAGEETEESSSSTEGSQSTEDGEPVTVRVGAQHVSGDVPLYVASEEGFFEEQGLDVETTRTSGDQMVSAVTAGQLDIAFLNVTSTLAAQAQDFDLAIVAPAQEAGESGPDAAALWVPADSDISEAGDLRGESIAVNGLNNINWLYAREWLEQNDVSADEVEFREINFPQMPDALLNGDVSAAYGTNPWQGNLLDEGRIDLLASPFSDVRPGMPIALYISTHNYATENPDVIEKFSAALQQAVAFIETNNEEARDLWAQRDDREPGSTQDTPMFPFSTTVDKDDLQFTADLMTEHGILGEGETVTIDDEFVLPIAQDPPTPE